MWRNAAPFGRHAASGRFGSCSIYPMAAGLVNCFFIAYVRTGRPLRAVGDTFQMHTRLEQSTIDKARQGLGGLLLGPGSPWFDG